VKRRLFNIAAVVASLAVCMALLSLWVRSHWMIDRIWYSPTRGVNYRVTLSLGSIIVSRSVLVGRTSNAFSDDFDRSAGWSFQSQHQTTPIISPFTDEGSHRVVQWTGFDYIYRNTSRPSFGTLAFCRVVLPIWLPTLIASMPSMILLARYVRHRHRMLKGLCPSCGYDLRASSERCPECGKQIAQIEAKA
jgi:hypothetical protein